MNFVPKRGNAALLCLLLFLASLLGGCAGSAAQSTKHPEETTVATEPPATIPSDGNPEDVTCQGSYTVTGSEAEAAKDTVVASMGDVPLTNSQLQVYYWLEVAAYRQAGHEIAPDFAKSLDTQVCQIDESVNSWQQYFLREALNTWAYAQALVLQSQQVPLATEEAYQPNERIHSLYFLDYPAGRVLYGYNEFYSPNHLHQSYLDNIPAMLEELAATLGFSDVNALTADLAGAGTDTEALAAVVQVFNYGYMYFTEMGYAFAPTAEDVDAYFTEHEAEYANAGITRSSGNYADMRHILLIPEGAAVADDGTVTASEDAWANCEQTANKLLNTYHNTIASITYYDPTPSTYGNFSELAVKHSADPGSAPNGGLYQGLVKGQLAEPLDSWLFDENRVQDETAVIRTDAGLHVVFFDGTTEIWYAAAEADLKVQMYRDLITAALESHPVSVDYSAVCLGEAGGNSDITLDTLLYPDIAHERYPVAPLYLQMDYPTTYYGNYPISSHGCGITTMSMLATYMSDTELTPPTLCARYGRYCGQHGTNRELFVITPSEMGFYLKDTVLYAEEAYAALQEGYPVVCIQRKGYWTGGGHFLLLEKLNEDGTVQVRDSNIINYPKLPGHSIDAHEWRTIPPSAACFWVFEKKVTHCDQCTRCAGADALGAPDVMFTQDYLCEKCSVALSRRNTYLS